MSIANELADKQRDIAVSEFFERNKHILGFDNTTRALITSVKEGVDNALDACEEGNVLPDIRVEIHEGDDDEYTLVIEDNGPGVVKRQVPKVFGRLLYGSQFHRIRQSRGQQGIGISAVVMYGQLTSGQPATICTRVGPDHPAYELDLRLDTKENEPEVVDEEIVDWDKDSGTRLEITMEARYVRGAQSVYEYLRTTSIVNPHAELTLVEPDGTTTKFPRSSEQLPPETVEIKPHPLGIELGQLQEMAKNTEARKITSFLQNDFCRVGLQTARKICDKAGIGEDRKPSYLKTDDCKALMSAFEEVRIVSPPTDCLSPIGETLIRRGLRTEFEDADLVATETRSAEVYGGHPFQIEAAIVHNSDKLPDDEQVEILRHANRVPLLYQRGGCVSTKAIEDIDWRRYDLDQRGGQGIPHGSCAILVHVASTNVPFTSESKDAVADIPEIRKEIELAVRECAREMRSQIRKGKKMKRLRQKEDIIRKIVPAMAEKSAQILDKDVPDYEKAIARIMNAVMVTPTIEYEQGVGHDITIEVRNYTSHGKRMQVMAELPAEGDVEDPEPDAGYRGNMIVWDEDKIDTGEAREFSYRVRGLAEADIQNVDIFLDGIDATLIAGAEAWEGSEIEETAPEPQEIDDGDEVTQEVQV
ncbi:DNA topoisomerase VI subunit B [Thermoplasmatales archaeon SW_10_69_26]|nr:MAG: DNA topoisomerase VI subunit B [Thermoplasmatales archaeon SW_10_69_26]